ncbi:PAS domain-containing protein [Flaviaesturariibacter flavus]|uniref:PAS domain-containing protein n=1 Tax=Flaviaesturariibacter flavus TaxID=2502780 RepID=A0A4R1B9H0_9BACT|nr:PAS domain-containing protein [Flaviaesturariibacter flavus]TCJ13561.1 PAS domain-containing protein [Flaviaesturariibacter flavus]
MKNTPLHGTYAVPEFLQGITDLCSLLLDGNPEPVLAIDKEYRIAVLNKAGERWLGRTRTAALGQRLFSLLPAMGNNGLLEALDDALRRGRTANLQTSSGDTHYQWRIQPLTDKFGARHGALCLLRDVSRQHRAEQHANHLEGQLQQRDFLLSNRAHMAETIIDASKDLIVVLDRDLRFCAANKAYQEYCRLEHKALMGELITDVFPQAQGSSLLQAVRRALGGGGAETLRDVPCLLKDGYCDIAVTPLQYASLVYGVLVNASVPQPGAN